MEINTVICYRLQQKGQERGSQDRWCGTKFRVMPPSLSCLTAVKAARPTRKNSTDLAEFEYVMHGLLLYSLLPCDPRYSVLWLYCATVVCSFFVLLLALVDMKVAWQRCDVMFWHADACKLPFLLLVGSSDEQFKVLKFLRNV